MGQIYGIYSKVEDKIIYIGQTIIGYENRFKKHINESKDEKCTKKIHKKIKKYGIENFKPILLLECDINLLNEKEKEYINFYNTYRNGCNLTVGGETMSGYKHTEETKIKIGKKTKYRWENERDKIIDSLKKRPPRKHSENELKKRSEQFKNKNPMHNDHVRQKLSQTCKNKYENGYINPKSKMWKITTPEKEIIITKEMKKYCKENGLGYNGMYYAYMNNTIYRGYKIEKMDK
jgi:group I intron endonuclease